MKTDHKHVAVIGAGVTGMTAADELLRMGHGVTLIEKTPFLGGHAIQLNCKAAESCVKCGACVVEEKLQRVTRQDRVTIHTGSEIVQVSGEGPYQITYQTHSPVVNAERCDGCGLCIQKCPVPGAILQGRDTRMGPYVAIRRELCRYFDNAACTLCREICPRGAITLAAQARNGDLIADAVVMATGFTPHNPMDKPYGYGRFQNVLTSLDAERRLREHLIMKRPSDGEPARRIAFIQCVGSRDARLGNNWCSKICCGSALRMARLIQSRQNEVHVTFFYIDVQNFGKDFHQYYSQVRQNVQMIRAIPGEIVENHKNQLKIIYFEPDRQTSSEALFDVVVLSVGLQPPGDQGHLSRLLSWPSDQTGFMCAHDDPKNSAPTGIFSAGTAIGPMSIAESVSSAEKTVFDIIRYFDRVG